MKQALSKLFVWLGKMMSEDNDHPSQIRFSNFYAIIILIPCVAFCLIYVTVVYSGLITYVLDAILIFIGGLFGLKVAQKVSEQKIPPETK